MIEKPPIKVGSTYRVKFPFVAESHAVFGDEAPVPDETWRPGVRWEQCSPEDFEAVAEAEGEMILTVVDTHKPGRYPERVFYTRKWIDPDGKEFGDERLRITTTGTFRRRATGYYHKYRIEGES